MTSKSLHSAMNEQLNKELYSSYMYLSMSAYFEAANYPGFAAWMRAQSNEENVHAMKFWEYVHDRGGDVTLLAIAQPPSKFASPLDAFEQALQAEKDNTNAIHALYATAVEEKDYPSQVFLNWFIQEQVEEEKTATQIVDTLQMVGDSAASLLLLDRELGSRQGEAGS
jgi:ferritin